MFYDVVEKREETFSCVTFQVKIELLGKENKAKVPLYVCTFVLNSLILFHCYLSSIIHPILLSNYLIWGSSKFPIYETLIQSE